MNESELNILIQKYNPHYISVEDRVREIAKQINLNSALILNAGCGEGTWSKIHKYLSNHKTVGIGIGIKDLMKNNVVDFRIGGDLGNLPFKDNMFDLIICEWVAEHLDRPEDVMKEFYRVLKPNGYLFISTSNVLNPIILLGGKIFPYSIVRRLHKILYNVEEEDVFPLRYKFNTLRKISKTMKELGFREDILMTANNPWYLKFNRVLCLFYILFERFCSKFNLRFLDIYLLGIYRKI